MEITCTFNEREHMDIWSDEPLLTEPQTLRTLNFM